MFSFFYAICLLIYCLKLLFKGNERLYRALAIAIEEHKRTGDKKEFEKFATSFLFILFFVFTKTIFYANLALHKIAFPFSSWIFLMHFYGMIICLFRRKRKPLRTTTDIVVGKTFTTIEVIFLIYYLCHRIF